MQEGGDTWRSSSDAFLSADQIGAVDPLRSDFMVLSTEKKIANHSLESLEAAKTTNAAWTLISMHSSRGTCRLSASSHCGNAKSYIID